MNKNILVICALGYATSTMIKKNIEDFLAENNIKDWKVEAIGVGMADGYVDKASIIVTSLELNPSDYKVPIVNGVPLISGINAEETLNNILEIIRKTEQ